MSNVTTMHRMNKQSAIPPVLERYEMKYTIPFSMVDDISQFIGPYCSMDLYSIKSPDSFYTINSLYFDSPQYLFLKLRLQKSDNRFNMRVRTYGESPVLPWFFEIKHKRGDIMRKYRAKAHSENIEQMLNTPDLLHHHVKNEKEEKNRLLFYNLVHTYNATPKVLIQYKRKAYISDTEEYARVTFDKNLRSMKQTEYSPFPVEDLLQPCDIQTAFDDNTCVILELKCYTSFVPLWMVDLIKTFQLNRRGFSKYMAAIKTSDAGYCGFDPVARSVLYDDDHDD